MILLLTYMFIKICYNYSQTFDNVRVSKPEGKAPLLPVHLCRLHERHNVRHLALTLENLADVVRVKQVHNSCSGDRLLGNLPVCVIEIQY